MRRSSRCWSTAACEEARRWPSTGPTLILPPRCCGYVAPWPGVDGELVVTETKTAKSRRVIPLSPTAERVLRDMRTRQMAERLRAGSMWQPTPYVSTTELGEPCDPRNALRALKAAAKRAKLPATVGLHTLRHSLPRSCCRLACRSRWSLRSSVMRVSRSPATYTATSLLMCRVRH